MNALIWFAVGVVVGFSAWTVYLLFTPADDYEDGGLHTEYPCPSCDCEHKEDVYP